MISVFVGYERREPREEYDDPLNEETADFCESSQLGS